MDQEERYKLRIEREKKARKEAERLLQAKARELFASNEELKKSKDNLQEENERRTYDLIRVQKLAKIASWRWNLKKNTIIWSTEMDFVLELDPNTYTNKARAYLKKCLPDERKRIKKFFYNIISKSSNNISDNELVIEHTIVFHQGKQKNLRVKCECIYDDNKELEIMLGTVQDITEHVDYRNQLNKRVKELEKLHEELVKAQIQADLENQRKSEFLSTVNHELRTPLTSIHGALELIKMMTPNDTKRKVDELIDIAYRNSHRLKFLVNDILDTEKIDSDNIKFNFKKYLITDLINEAVELNKPYAQKYNVDFKITGTIPEIYINADKDRFFQIMSNLLSNAAKYSHEGDKVDISAYLKSEKLVISITDCGLGMPEEFKDRIFTKFAQADNSDSREKEGTGLGLYLTQKMVEKHNGKVSFKTKEGKGTAFFVHLPYEEK